MAARRQVRLIGRVAFLGGLLSSALMGRFVSAGESLVGNGAAIDFVYVSGAREVMVPFDLGRTCDKSFLDPIFGLTIEQVTVDGHRVTAVRIAESAIDDGSVILDKPGPSFRYLVPISRLQSIAMTKPFSGRAFPVSK